MGLVGVVAWTDVVVVGIWSEALRVFFEETVPEGDLEAGGGGAAVFEG